jgi:predicted nucleic acid-binding protein
MFYCELVYVELLQCAYKIPLGSGGPKEQDMRVRRRALPTLDGLHNGWHQLLDALPHVRLCVEELSETAMYTVEDQGLESMDAFHAAAGLWADGPIFTFDTAFARMPEGLPIYTDPTLVSMCRRIRSKSRSHRAKSGLGT